MAIGDFGLVLDSVAFPQMESVPGVLRKRTKNVALLVTQALTYGDIYFRSLAIDDAGLIDDTPIDTLHMPNATHRDKALIHWGDDVFAVYSNDHLDDCHLSTVACDEDGEIADAALDYLRMNDAVNVNKIADLIKPHPGILLTGPTKPDPGYHLQTATISAAGAISDSVIDSMVLPFQPRTQRFRQGAGNRIVDLVMAAGGYWIFSLTCTSTGDLPDSASDSWGLITCIGWTTSLCKISDTVFAIFAKDSDGTSRIRTFSINPDGSINKTWIDTEEVETASADATHMMEMGRGYFLLAYVLPDLPWRIKTYFISHGGQIQDGAIDTLNRSGPNRGNFQFEHLNGNIWMLHYEDVVMQVRIDTIDVSTPFEARPHNELTLGIGP